MRDPRREDRCTYPIEYILTMAMMMHCFQCGSRRQFAREMGVGRLPPNIWRMVRKAGYDAACHTDTMNKVLGDVDPGDIEELIRKMFDTLRRCRALDNARFCGFLVCAVDATGVLSFKKPHCEFCTHSTSSSGVKTYFHNVLIAKIVTPWGLAVPLAYEFIENPGNGQEYDKQDCEIKAWRRLSEKIRSSFPRLPLNISADGLYADETTFKKCADNGWNFVITLKDAKLSSLTSQLPSKTGAVGWDGEARMRVANSDGKMVERIVRWKTPLRYHGKVCHVVELEEVDAGGERMYYNRWVTNIKPDRDNAFDIATIGRLRWKIENEGINTEKNAGYEMQHAYSRKDGGWKNYYLLLQISHLLNDLVRFSDIIAKAAENPKATFDRIYGTIRNYCKRLLRSFQDGLVDLELLVDRKFQMRFVGS